MTRIWFLAALTLCAAGPALKNEPFRIKDVPVPGQADYVALAKDIEKRYLAEELPMGKEALVGFKDMRPTTTTFFIGVKNTLLKPPDGLAVAPNWEAAAGLELVVDRGGNLQSAGLRAEEKMSMRAKVGEVPIDPGEIKQSDTMAIELGARIK